MVPPGTRFKGPFMMGTARAEECGKTTYGKDWGKEDFINYVNTSLGYAGANATLLANM